MKSLIAVAIAVWLLQAAVPSKQARSSALSFGPSAVGFEMRPLPAGSPRPGRVHLWFPIERCNAPITYGDYLRLSAGPMGDPAVDLRRAHDTPDRPMTDDEWSRVMSTPMRACRESAPAAVRAPIVLAIHLPGAWPVAAEMLASRGYVFASIERAPGRPPSAELTARIKQRMADFVEDLEVAAAMVGGTGPGDPQRIGLVGQSHALLMFAMRHPVVRAIALQDSGFRDGPEAEATQQTGLWTPATLRAPLLHAIAHEHLAEETRWDALRTAMPAPWTRVVIEAASGGHDDVTADGYLVRTRALRAAPLDPTRIAVFEGLLGAQAAFFDRHLAGRADAPDLARVLDRVLFTIERRE